MKNKASEKQPKIVQKTKTLMIMILGMGPKRLGFENCDLTFIAQEEAENDALSQRGVIRCCQFKQVFPRMFFHKISKVVHCLFCLHVMIWTCPINKNPAFYDGW